MILEPTILENQNSACLTPNDYRGEAAGLTGMELHAADYCWERACNPDVDPVSRAAYIDAIRILRDREMRTAFLPVTNTAKDLKLHSRGQHCGNFTMEGTAHDGRDKRYVRANCKCWNCQHCGPRKAKRYKMTIGREAERLGLQRMMTLTLDPKKTPVKGAVQEIKKIWARFRAQLRNRYGAAPNYICVMEFQHATKLPHLHILIDRYVEFAWTKRVWMEAGGGEHVHLKGGGNGFRKVAHYLSKYLTKDILMSAPKRSRRVTTSKAVQLNAKMQSAALYAWDLMRCKIFEIFKANAGRIEGAEWGADSVLQSFSIPKNQRENLCLVNA